MNTTTIEAALAIAQLQDEIKAKRPMPAVFVTVDGKIFRIDFAALIIEGEPVNLARFMLDETEKAIQALDDAHDDVSQDTRRAWNRELKEQQDEPTEEEELKEAQIDDVARTTLTGLAQKIVRAGLTPYGAISRIRDALHDIARASEDEAPGRSGR